MRRIAYLALLLLLLAAGCGEVPPAAPPGQGPTLVVEQPSTLPEEVPTLAPDQFTVPLPPTVTPMPYPPPTRQPRTPRPLPTATPSPKVIVLGAEQAPEAERETYVSATVVIAKVGDGPGEIGFYRPSKDELPLAAQHLTVDARGNIYILDVVNQRVVKFDPEGQFVSSLVYGDAVQGPGDLAADADGRVYIYDVPNSAPTREELVPNVKLFDPEGKLLWKAPVPSWFTDQRVLAMRVDEQGTLWVQGEGYSPNAPIIDGQPYPEITVPLGNAAGPFDEARQQNVTMPGTIGSRGTYFSYSPTAADLLYLYDRQGQRIFACPQSFAGRIQVGQRNNIYLISSNGSNPTYTIKKYDQQGRLVASFDLPLGALQIDTDGTAYGLTMDWQTWATYYGIRAEHK